MPRVKRYNPLTDPKPKKWFKGYVSRAQRRHFMADARLAKFRPGMDWWTPPRGHAAVAGKMAGLPNRLHPIKRRSR